MLLLLQVLVNTDASLAKQEKLTGRWMQMEHLCAFSLVVPFHARTQELARAPSQNAELAHQHTRKKDKTDTYSGFGGALAYGYGFRITRSAFGIVAVFGAQNSFCH